jgi:hypothetical protein
MNGVDVSATNTAAHTADIPQLLLEHHLKQLRLPTILREYDKVARPCAVEQVDYQHYLLRVTGSRTSGNRLSHPASEVPRHKDHGQLRLPGHPVVEQDSGA